MGPLQWLCMTCLYTVWCFGNLIKADLKGKKGISQNSMNSVERDTVQKHHSEYGWYVLTEPTVKILAGSDLTSH